MASIFTRIINREIPSFTVAEDDQYIAFLDITPLVEGHVLVVPKKEIDYIFDLDDATLQGLILFSKKVAAGIRKAVPCLRVGVTVVGLEVPHTHVHLVPLNHADDISFTHPRLNQSKEQLAATAEKIRKAL